MNSNKSLASIKFSLAQSFQAEAISRLVNSAYRPEPNNCAGWTHESLIVMGSRIAPAQVTQILSQSQYCIYLAHFQNTLVGAIQATRLADSIELGMFAVDPAFQNSSIGSQLMAHAEQTAGADAMTSHIYVVHTQEALIQFYERRGYRKTGKLEPYPVNAGVGTPKGIELHLVHMVKQLRF